MDFTDEQIMQFVDGEATQDLANKIEKARENNKELNSRIYKFQLANTVMLKHTQEKKEMPELFYARLRKKRIEQEESLDEEPILAFSSETLDVLLLLHQLLHLAFYLLLVLINFR